MTENTNIENENEYLELTNQLKASYDAFESKNQDLETENDDLKKSIITIYGLIRTLDDYNNNYILGTTDGKQEFNFLLNTCLSFINGVIDADII